MSSRRKKEWFDDDEFWKTLYPYIFPKSRFDETPDQMKKVLALTKPSGKYVLDLCCGPGRCAIALAKAGYKVTGVDRTKYLLDRARSRARTAKAKIEWVQEDMRDFIRGDSFDLAVSMFTSFGYFDDKAQDVQVLKNIFTSLKPGGGSPDRCGGKRTNCCHIAGDRFRGIPRTVQSSCRGMKYLTTGRVSGMNGS